MQENNQEQNEHLKKINVQTISTSILIVVSRAFATNRFINDKLNSCKLVNGDDLDEKIIENYYSKHILGETPSNFSFYDPYSYLFVDSEMGNSFLDKILKEEEEVEGANQKVEVTSLSFNDKMSKWDKVMKRFPNQSFIRRTKFIDHLLTCHVINGNITQLVIVGSGFDSRTQRMPFSDRVTIFDVDMPSTIELKTKIMDNAIKTNMIKPRSKSINKYIGADLSKINLQTLLLENGFDKNKPTFWLMEGLLMYLDTPSVESLFSIVSNLSSPGSAIMAQIFRFFPEKLSNASFAKGTFKYFCSDPTSFFSTHTPLYSPICHYTYSDIGCLFGIVPKKLLVEDPDSMINEPKDGNNSWLYFEDNSWYSFLQQFQSTN